MVVPRALTNMFEAVQVQPEGDTTPARFAATASRLGYDGLVLMGTADLLDRVTCDRLASQYDLDIVPGACLTVQNRETANAAIDRARAWADVVAVTPNNPDVERYLAERERVDVLGPADEPIEATVANMAEAHGVYLTLDLGPALRTQGAKRVDALRALERKHRIVDHHGTPVVVTASARSHLALRAPRELLALGETIGLSKAVLKRGLRAWKEIVTKHRERRDDRFIEPGVRVRRDETNDR